VRHNLESTRVLASGDVAGIALAAYPAFARPLAGIVIERDGVPSIALTLMLLGTVALASIALVQLVRDRRAVRRQAELLTTVSHELRTPLAQILLYSETLALDRVRGDDAKRAAAQRIVDEARRLIETVSNVVGLTRQERATSSVTPVGPVIESAITRVRALSDARAKVIVSVSGTPRVRLGDSALLQALTNVLDNALKFGSASQTVMVSAVRDGGIVRITVEDEGPGIPHAVRHRIWNKYFRANGASDASGAGIGLWIVRDIVVRAGGRVHADDAAKGGARVVIDLPAADDA
jgi:signal transduction histidine kinase